MEHRKCTHREGLDSYELDVIMATVFKCRIWGRADSGVGACRRVSDTWRSAEPTAAGAAPGKAATALAEAALGCGGHAGAPRNQARGQTSRQRCGYAVAFARRPGLVLSRQ